MTSDLDWCVPESCSLPVADQDGRVAEWVDLLGTAVDRVDTTEGEVRLVLDRAPGRAAAVADLADRETRCCPFLSFDLEVTEQTLALTVRADSAHTEELKLFAAQAGRGRST